MGFSNKWSEFLSHFNCLVLEPLDPDDFGLFGVCMLSLSICFEPLRLRRSMTRPPISALFEPKSAIDIFLISGKYGYV